MGWQNYCEKIISILPKNRLLALDVFRGLTITAMVLVNNPGSWSHVYPPMLHAQWNGWTPTDLIFPFFVFIVGVSVAIVMNREVAKGTNKLSLIKNASVRAAKLFGLGLFLALFYYNFFAVDYSWIESRLMSVRFMGVLQRLGLVFIFTVIIVLYFDRLGRALWIAALLLGYWGVMMFIPYSDNNGIVYQGLLEHGNSLVAWFDHLILGSNHLYYSTAQPFSFDPEGILSTLPAVAGALAGVFTGDLLTDNSRTLKSKTKTMLFWGVGLIIAGELYGLVFPINKALWTSSFVVLTTGWALFTLSILTWLIDIKGHKNWSAPFVVFGANAILFYLFSAVVARLFIMIPVGNISLQGWLYHHVYSPVFGDLNGSLMYAISFLLMSYVVMHVLYKKQVFFKV